MKFMSMISWPPAANVPTRNESLCYNPPMQEPDCWLCDDTKIVFDVQKGREFPCPNCPMRKQKQPKKKRPQEKLS